MSVITLGTGNIGGKAQGLRFLLKHTHLGYKVPKYIVGSSDFWEVPTRPASELWRLCLSFTDKPRLIKDITPETIELIQKAMEQAGLSHRIAIRSSSPFEDTISSPGAGIFTTEFHAQSLDTETGLLSFKAALLKVLNSIYGPKANAYYRLMDYQDIPPLAVVIQDLVGQEWDFAPGYFFPLVSGIINTASPETIIVATVHGFGHDAVNGDPTARHSFNRETLMLLGVAGDYVPISRVLRQNGRLVSRLETFPNNLSPSSNIHQQLASIAKKLEKAAKQSLDLEWASPDGEEIFLLQCRPIMAKKPRSDIAIPDIPFEQQFIWTNQVSGQGQHSFTHIIDFTNASPDSVPIDSLKYLSKQYPNALFIIQQALHQNKSIDCIILHFLPYTKCLVIKDLTFNFHIRSPIDHLSLNIAAAGKIVLVSKPYPSHSMKPSSKIDGFFGNRVVIYDCSENPIHVVADDEQKIALVYWEKDPAEKSGNNPAI